jgi:hypothetical protein
LQTPQDVLVQPVAELAIIELCCVEPEPVLRVLAERTALLTARGLLLLAIESDRRSPIDGAQAWWTEFVQELQSIRGCRYCAQTHVTRQWYISVRRRNLSLLSHFMQLRPQASPFSNLMSQSEWLEADGLPALFGDFESGSSEHSTADPMKVLP